MLLRLIDRYNEKNSDAIEIVLQTPKDSVVFTAEYFPSPMTENFRKTLAWYFQHYTQGIDQQPDDKNLPEKIIKLGQHMGDRLLGEDLQLIKIRDIIEETGYEQLTVEVESSRVEFFQEFWEALILPDAKYVLSAVSKGFVRRFIGKKQPEYDVECHYGLSAGRSSGEEGEILSDSAVSAEGSRGGDNTPPMVDNTAGNKPSPLTILHIIARTPSAELGATPSNGFNASVESLCWGDAINYALWPYQGWQDLQQRLADKEHPVHILHYDGPVELKDGMPHFKLGGVKLGGVKLGRYTSETESVAVSELAELLVSYKVALLSVDASAYLEQDSAIEADLGLASIAHVASAVGLTNVLGMGKLCDPWTTTQCFKAVYDRLATGLTLSQAITEARKFLQTQIDSQHFHVKAIPFHTWPLLVHYGGQAVTFFDAPQQQTDLSTSPAYGSIRQHLLGFYHELLPPEAHYYEDGTLLDILIGCRSAAVLKLTGHTGSGKSHLVHQAGFYLLQHKRVEYGFYFDCATGFYSKDNVLQMIAPIIDDSTDGEKDGEKDSEKKEARERSDNEELEKKLMPILAKKPCCFVFDDVLQLGLQQWPDVTDNQVSELYQFLNALVAQGHIVIISGESGESGDSASPFAGTYREISIAAPSSLSQRALATEVLRQCKIEDKAHNSDYLALLDSLQGHPFLIQKVLPRLAVDSAESLLADVSSQLSASSDKVESYYAWQWTLLPSVWQKLILLLVDLPGVLLEMLMLVCDQREPLTKEDKPAGEDDKTPPAQGRGKRLFEPAAQLFAHLGDSDVQLSKGIDQWELAGFVASYPHGRVLDPRCLPFLREKQSTEARENTDAVILMVSQVVCEGVRLLAQHLHSQPNQAITHNLLMNRRLWKVQLEKLWSAEDYLGFIRAKAALDSLLRQARLGEESAAWSLDLLKRGNNLPTEETPFEATIAWFTLALSALGQVQAVQESFFSEVADQWQTWLDKCNTLFEQDSGEQKNMALFHHVVLFLEDLYRRQGQWQACRHVSDIAYKIYLSHKVWPRVVQSLKSLAHCSFALNEKQQGDAYEQQLLQSLPFEQFPPNFKTELTIGVITAKAERGDIEQAQLLLKELKESNTEQQLNPMLDKLQADIAAKASQSAPTTTTTSTSTTTP